MSEENKKISFGFTKTSKKQLLPVSKALPKVENTIQFIDCLEGNSIKVIGGDASNEKKELVIPMIKDNLLKENMILAMKARMENSVLNEKKSKEDIVSEEKTQFEEKNNSVDPNKSGDKIQSENKNNSGEFEKPLTLDEMAAKEILEDSIKQNDKKEETSVHVLPLQNKIGSGEQESTLEDYENIPINEFGFAMLRGMGWNPKNDVGKTQQTLRPSSPLLRPKGMGLGADKVIKPQQNSANGTELVLKKGSFIKVLAGQNKNLYGVVEGFDEHVGRVIVKLTISSSVVSLNENLVLVVSKGEYDKNSKVLNVIKYDEYKEKESKLVQEPETKSNEELKDQKIVSKGETDSNEQKTKHRTFVKTEPEVSLPKKLDREESSEKYESKKSVSKKLKQLSDSDDEKKRKKKIEHYSSDSDDTDSRHNRKRHKKTKKRRSSGSDDSSDQRHDRERGRKHKKKSKRYSDSDDSSDEDRGRKKFSSHKKSRRHRSRSRSRSKHSKSSKKKHKSRKS